MVSRQLVWGGRLVTVTLPVDAESWGERGRWSYVQVRASGGDESAAFRAALVEELPGLGYGEPTERPYPFSYAVCGRAAAELSEEFGTSSQCGPARSRSQKPKPHAPSRPSTCAVSGNADQHTRPPRFSTSNASRPRGPAPVAAPASSRPPKQHAKPRTGGWMGSVATTA